MTTVHTGDRTSGCDTCLKNDYIEEIVKENNWQMCSPTYENALSVWVNNSPTYYKWEEWENWISDFEEAYCGEWGSEQEFADNMADETITPDLPEMGQIYFDYNKFARDLFLGDYWSNDGYIFRNF